MRDILLNVATQPRAQIAGREFAGRRFELRNSDGAVIKETPVLMEDTVKFTAVEVGNYVAAVFDIGVDGSVLDEAAIEIEVTAGGPGDQTYPGLAGLSYMLE